MASIEDGQVNQAEFATDEDFAAYWVKRLEKQEAARTGRTVTDVRPIIARRVGIAPGTLENLRRGRIKAIKKNVYEWLLAAADRQLRAEIALLEHERTVLATKTSRSDRRDLRQVDAHVAAARAALSQEG